LVNVAATDGVPTLGGSLLSFPMACARSLFFLVKTEGRITVLCIAPRSDGKFHGLHPRRAII